MNLKHSHIIILMGVCLLSACTKVMEDHGIVQPNAIKVKVSATGTRGSVIYDSNITTACGKFMTNCWVDADEYYKYDGQSKTTLTEAHYINDQTVSYGSEGWAFDVEQYWINKVNMRFWSYAPYDATDNGMTITSSDLKKKDEISFTYKSKLNTSDQKDLLFSYTTSNEEHDGTGGSEDLINIHFFHALAQVNFAVSPAAAEDGDDTFDNSKYEIVSISIAGAPSQGSCVFDGAEANAATSAPFGFAWSDQSVPATFVNSCNSDYSNTLNTGKWTKGSYTNTSGTFVLYRTNDVFFMIPNSASGRTVNVSFKRKSDNTILSKQISVNDVWKAGEYYTYKIKAKDVKGDVRFSLSLVDWTYAEEDIKYHTVEGNVLDALQFTSGTFIPGSDRKIVVKDGAPIEAKFRLQKPLGCKIHISMTGYIGAFEITDLTNDTINGTDFTTFKINPLIDSPEIDYTAQLHFYVIFNDGKVINADDVVQAGGDPYTIVLPAM